MFQFIKILSFDKYFSYLEPEYKMAPCQYLALNFPNKGCVNKKKENNDWIFSQVQMHKLLIS